MACIKEIQGSFIVLDLTPNEMTAWDKLQEEGKFQDGRLFDTNDEAKKCRDAIQLKAIEMFETV